MMGIIELVITQVSLTVDDVAVSSSVDISADLVHGILNPVLYILVVCQINTCIIPQPDPDFIHPVLAFKQNCWFPTFYYLEKYQYIYILLTTPFTELQIL